MATSAVGKTLEQTLEDAEGRLRLLTAHTQGILFELDQHACFVRVWTSDPKLLARPEHEILGRTVVEALGRELGQRHHEAALETVKNGTAACYQYELNVPGGHRHFACESVAVPSPTGAGRHAVFWIRDITDQVELQRKLVEIERLASIGTLAAGVAHEVNNPLAYMMLNVELLRKAIERIGSEPSSPPEMAQMTNCLSMIQEGALRVQRIVRDLQQFAVPDDPVESVSLQDALDLSVELARGSCESRAQLRVQWAEVPRVMAHQGRLVQVFTQLLSNAAEAITVGEPQDNDIVVSVRSSGASAVEVQVRDTGSGMSACDAERIFEPFFTTKEQGTGLGLAICRRIVNSFKGEIRLEPSVPRGCVVTVQLPVAG